MSDLIKRLERGERWETDGLEVLRALGLNPAALVCDLPMGLPRPLDSADDALRLVPEGAVSNHRGGGNAWECEVYVPDDGYIKLFEGAGETLAIALTIAILKATLPPPPASHIQE